MQLKACVRRNDHQGIQREVDFGAEAIECLPWAFSCPAVSQETLRFLASFGVPAGGMLVHSAAESGHLERVLLAIEFDPNPNAVDDNGYTALHRAALSQGPDRMAIVDLLLEAGVDRWAMSRYHESALAFALSGPDLELAQRLLQGVDEGAVTGWRRTILATLRNDREALSRHRDEINWATASFGHWKPIYVALRMGDLSLVEYLVSLGATLKVADPQEEVFNGARGGEWPG